MPINRPPASVSENERKLPTSAAARAGTTSRHSVCTCSPLRLTTRIARADGEHATERPVAAASTSGEMPARRWRDGSLRRLRSPDRSGCEWDIDRQADGDGDGDAQDDQPVDADADVREHLDAVDREQLRTRCGLSPQSCSPSASSTMNSPRLAMSRAIAGARPQGTHDQQVRRRPDDRTEADGQR